MTGLAEIANPIDQTATGNQAAAAIGWTATRSRGPHRPTWLMPPAKELDAGQQAPEATGKSIGITTSWIRVWFRKR